MAKNEAKIRFTAETSSFNDSIKKANSEMGRLRAELKLNETQMRGSGASVEGLENKHRILTQQLQAAESKSEALAQKVNKAAQIYGESSSEVNRLRTQLANAQTAEERIRQAVSACNSELNAQKAAAGSAGSASSQLAAKISQQESRLASLKSEYADYVVSGRQASSEAQKLAREIQSLSSELNDNKSKMSGAAQAANELDGSVGRASSAASSAGGGFTVFKGAIADLASNVIQGAISKLSEFISYLGQLPQETREFRQDVSTLDTAFKDAGLSSEQAKKTFKDTYEVFGEDDRAVETANNIARMAKSQKDLDKWTTITTGVWGKYQDSLPVEGLAEAAGETAKTGQVTGVFADALNWSSEAAAMFSDYMGGDVVTAEDAFNVALSECSSEQERQSLITETMMKLYSGAADQYRESAGSLMEANGAALDSTDAQADLAAAIEPVTTKFTELKTQLITGITPALSKVSKGMTAALGWLNKHPTVLKVVVTALGVLAAELAVAAVALGAYTVAQWAMNSALLANPITWIVLGIMAAIALLVAAGVAIYSNWDTIKAKASEVWNSIKNVISTVVNAIKDVISRVFGAIKTVITAYLNAYRTVIMTVWNAIKTVVTTVVNAIRTVITTVFGAVRSRVTSIFNAIKSVTIAVWNRIRTAITTPIQVARSVVNSVVNAIKNKFHTLSSIKGTVTGIFNSVKNAITHPIQTAKSIVTSAIGRIKSAINNCRPKLHISVPDIHVSGGKAPWGIGGKGVKPSFSVTWHKAGAVFTRPTIFDTPLGLQGVGEAGAEAVMPITVLQDYINRAFERNLNINAEGGGGSVYNFYVNDAMINSSEEMRSVAKDFIEEMVRLGGMNR